jgi:hypothetical protein
MLAGRQLIGTNLKGKNIMKVKLVQVDTAKCMELPDLFTAGHGSSEPGSTDKPVVDPDTIKAIDKESLPVYEQGIVLVIKDEIAKAEKAGIKDPEIDITLEKVDAKVRELKRQKRKERKLQRAESKRH